MCLKYFIVTLIILVGSVSCLIENRVLDGTPALISRYPFMVSLRGSNGVHICGASIIAPRWILTAAHCVDGRTASQISVQYASSTVSPNSANVFAVKRIVMHEDYAPDRRFANDIALLQLRNVLLYDYETIAPVTLPEPYIEVPQISVGTPGVLAGWGLNDTDGVDMIDLQEVTLKIYSDEECNRRHKGVTTTDQICAGVDEGGKGQCSGDSGGPLVFGGSLQLGIVSWSEKPCGQAPYPGVYTKVSHYIGWINKQMYK